MKLVIFGATSAIAMAAAREFAVDKATLLLVARSEDKLTALRNDLLTRGAKEVYTYVADLSDVQKHDDILEQIDSIVPGYDAVLLAYGTLGDQRKCEVDFARR